LNYLTSRLHSYKEADFGSHFYNEKQLRFSCPYGPRFMKKHRETITEKIEKGRRNKINNNSESWFLSRLEIRKTCDFNPQTTIIITSGNPRLYFYDFQETARTARATILNYKMIERGIAVQFKNEDHMIRFIMFAPNCSWEHYVV
jgi:hypothetical protein